MRAKLAQRNFPTEMVAKILAEDSPRREILQRAETMRSRRNQIAKDIGTKKRSGEDVSALMEESQKLNVDLERTDTELTALQAKVDEMLLYIPNILDESVPNGKDSSENKMVRKVGEPWAPEK